LQLHRLTRKRTFQQFCTDFKVDSVTNLELKWVHLVNMPLRHIIMVLLGSGWVATEYLKDTIVLRDYVKLQFPHYQKEQPL
jgi:hypothetical protein